MARELSLFAKKEIRIDWQGNAIRSCATKKVERWYQPRWEGKGQEWHESLAKEALTTARDSREEVVKVGFDVSQIHHEHIHLRSCSWRAGKMK